MNVTNECHKGRKTIERKEPAYYIKLWTNKPPHVPFGQLFEDRKEYAYARQVISRFKRGKLAKSQTPMSQEGDRLGALGEVPVDVHHTPWVTAVPPHWVGRLQDVVLSKNRNGQVVYRDPQGFFGLVAHRNGTVHFYPYLNVKTAWDRLGEYVRGSWGDDAAKLFLEDMHKSGVKTHVAFHTPGVNQFRVRVPSVATIESDSTPWKDGTTEVVIDTKDMQDSIAGMNKLVSTVLKNEAVFSENLKSHVALVQDLRAVVNEMRAERKMGVLERFKSWAIGTKDGKK
jgi:hypothetical protein